MIKFFRKIRENLLMENKTGRYFKYAIGEIVLVVVGILIALSINNWNEGQKKNKLEKSTLAELRSNLIDDITDTQQRIRFYHGLIYSSNIVIEFIDGKIPYNDSLKVHLGKIPAQDLLTPNKVAYENLKAIGINLISNDSLRKAIGYLYEVRYTVLENMEKLEYQHEKEKLADFYLKEMQEYSFFEYAIPVNYQSLISNQYFRNLIMHRKLKMKNYEHLYNKNIQMAEEIIGMIDMVIEK